MGIQGLMSYITNQKKFLRDHELHDTNLVIDGNCFIAQLYRNNNCNYCFGGDYEEYAYYVNEFFDELLECKITPLIIYDGAMEDKKIDTILKRSQDRILNASVSTSANQLPILPVLAKDTFKYIAKQRKIKSVQSTFEADDHIASVAKILNCPVLSFDSDFFIYDVMYIPLNTLKPGISPNSKGDGFVKQCKIFKAEYFLESFYRMDKNVLPLAAALLGNDYLSSSLFNKFFSTLKVSRKFKKKNSLRKRHVRIEALFKWMQNRSLDNAITSVVNKLDPEKRQSVIEVIEVIVNGFLNPSSEMLGPLGYSQQEIDALMQSISIEQYTFDYVKDFRESKKVEADETDLSCSEDEEKTLPSADSLIFKPGSNININETLPSWFLERYHTARFPAFFMDIINRRLIVASEQMEDFSQPSCINISLKIISSIFRLLHNGITDFKSMKYITRGSKLNVETYELDCDKYKFPFEIPTLQKLKDFPMSKRKEILTGTLGVNDKMIAEFPPTWRLYIATIKYWLDEADAVYTTTAHLYTLVLLLIHHVIKKFIKDQSYFGLGSLKIKNTEEVISNQGLDKDMLIKTALDNVTKQDCLLALNYFQSHKQVKKEKEFKIAVVHSFSLLQNCLKQSINFNALLGTLYPDVNIAEFFSGTLAYNLYNEIEQKKPRYNHHITKVFQDSPSVLQLFVSVSTKMQDMAKQKNLSIS